MAWTGRAGGAYFGGRGFGGPYLLGDLLSRLAAFLLRAGLHLPFRVARLAFRVDLGSIKANVNFFHTLINLRVLPLLGPNTPCTGPAELEYIAMAKVREATTARRLCLAAGG